jgi:hypothetical protein
MSGITERRRAVLNNIKPYYNPENLCIENVFTSLCNAIDKPIANLYGFSWNFGYIPYAVTNGTLPFGKSIVPSRDKQGMNSEQINAVEMFCGIYPMLHMNYGTDNFVEIVKAELAEDRPIIVGCDIFYCNWHKSYQKYHSLHYCLIKGINEDGFVCVDDTLASEDGNLILPERPESIMLPFDVLKNFNFGYFTFKFKKNECEYSADDMIYISALKTITGYNGTSDYNVMRLMAQEMEAYMDIDKEIQGFEDAWAVDLVRASNYIIWNRKNYSLFVEDKKMYKNKDVRFILEQMKQSISIWTGIKNYIFKYAMFPDMKFQVSKVKDEIMKVSQVEESLAYQIVSMR